MSDPLYADCTIECERAPDCATCRKRKKPVGRSAPMEMANALCDSDCPGYREEPTPGHLWPGELAREREAQRPEEEK